MNVIEADIAVIGQEAPARAQRSPPAEADTDLRIALISNVYPAHSHTLAAEGGRRAGP